MKDKLKNFFALTWYGRLLGIALLCFVATSVGSIASAMIGGGPIVSLLGAVSLGTFGVLKFAEFVREARFASIVKSVDEAEEPKA